MRWMPKGKRLVEVLLAGVLLVGMACRRGDADGAERRFRRRS